MVRFRNAFYCNLKLGLIFLVIYAHWIEPEIRSRPELYRLYRLIYLVHMPLFAFLSGLFLKNWVRQLKRILVLYLLCQAFAVLVGKIPWDTPFWHLWYLLSLSCWLLSGPLAARKRLHIPVLVLSVALGCLAGLVPGIGRSWSASRTLVFFPYFWLGVILPKDLPWHRLRLPGLLGFCTVLALRPRMDVVTLYQAGPCDPLVRLQCYGYALLLGLFVLSWCPRRRFPWTRAGADTMAAYLLHGPVVLLLRPIAHPAAATIVFLCIIHKATQWHSVYGIIGREACPWPDLKSSTRPRVRRSTAFSWP